MCCVFSFPRTRVCHLHVMNKKTVFHSTNLLALLMKIPHFVNNLRAVSKQCFAQKNWICWKTLQSCRNENLFSQKTFSRVGKRGNIKKIEFFKCFQFANILKCWYFFQFQKTWSVLTMVQLVLFAEKIINRMKANVKCLRKVYNWHTRVCVRKTASLRYVR